MICVQNLLQIGVAAFVLYFTQIIKAIALRVINAVADLKRIGDVACRNIPAQTDGVQQHLLMHAAVRVHQRPVGSAVCPVHIRHLVKIHAQIIIRIQLCAFKILRQIPVIIRLFGSMRRKCEQACR